MHMKCLNRNLKIDSHECLKQKSFTLQIIVFPILRGDRLKRRNIFARSNKQTIIISVRRKRGTESEISDGSLRDFSLFFHEVLLEE